MSVDTPQRQRARLTSLAYTTAKGASGAIPIDATVTTTHTAEVEATDSPIETGATVTDHLHFKPRSCRVDGAIADFPLATNPKPFAGTVDEGHDGRATEVLDLLYRLQEEAALFTVYTRRRVYSNMHLAGVAVISDAKGGNTIHVSLTMRELRFADSQFVPIVATKTPKAQGTQNDGHQTGEPATGSETLKSWAAQLTDFGSDHGLPVPAAFKKPGVK
jgi:hypothetical protein